MPCRVLDRQVGPQLQMQAGEAPPSTPGCQGRSWLMSQWPTRSEAALCCRALAAGLSLEAEECLTEKHLAGAASHCCLPVANQLVGASRYMGPGQA